MLIVVYDNNTLKESLRSGHGFSCLIKQGGKSILFDTGDNPHKLSFNLTSLNIDPLDIEIIVLSHYHMDHCGGLKAVIDKNKDLTLYYPKAFPETFSKDLTQRGIRGFRVDKITQIAEGVFAGPQLAGLGPKEIPLAIKTDRGLVIITGCAHPGIVKIVKRLKESLGERVYLVLGGFHLEFSLGLDKVVSGLKDLGVEKIAPCHCTGRKARELFAREFKENFIKVGSGAII